MQSKFHKIFTVGTTAVMLLSSIAVFPAFGGSAENVMTADEIPWMLRDTVHPRKPAGVIRR